MAYDNQVLKEYYKRSYFAVDGLWFMKVEERFSFEEALELDLRVWEVLGKIQARKARELLDIKGDSVADLISALRLKWTAEDYDFEVEGEEVLLKKCPWLETMKKSGREKLAHRIGEAICSAEYPAWAREFNPRIDVEVGDKICCGGKACRLKFKLRDK